MPTWERIPPHTPTRCREDVEADTRVLMAKMANIAPRGFDSIKARNLLHTRIDVLLDEHAMFVAVEQVIGT